MHTLSDKDGGGDWIVLLTLSDKDGGGGTG